MKPGAIHTSSSLPFLLPIFRTLYKYTKNIYIYIYIIGKIKKIYINEKNMKNNRKIAKTKLAEEDQNIKS